MADTSSTGIFFDTKAQKVVRKQPEEGIQILAPGGEITDAVNAEVERWEQVAAGEPAAVETVTTKTVTGKG